MDDKQRDPGGEWKLDESGRRYRMTGTIKEYEMEINGVPQSVFLASQKAQREKQAAKYAEERARAAERAAKQRNCPFTDSMHPACKGDQCALYLNGCTLAKTGSRPPAKDTKGLLCPFSRYRAKCREDCALYKEGCALTSIVIRQKARENNNG